MYQDIVIHEYLTEANMKQYYTHLEVGKSAKGMPYHHSYVAVIGRSLAVASEALHNQTFIIKE
jgi:hypothetical protein